MVAHINLHSIDNYLSGMCSLREEWCPQVYQNRRSRLVSHTLKGAKCQYGTPVWRKLPLSHVDLQTVSDSLPMLPSHDNLLFLAQLFNGCYGLLRLGELTWPDNRAIQSYDKETLHTSVTISTTATWLQPAPAWYSSVCLYFGYPSEPGYVQFGLVC